MNDKTSSQTALGCDTDESRPVSYFPFGESIKKSNTLVVQDTSSGSEIVHGNTLNCNSKWVLW